MTQTLSDDFRTRVEAFLAATGTKPTEFGRAAIGDPCFVLNLRRGRSPKLTTVDRVLGFMATAESVKALVAAAPRAQRSVAARRAVA